MGCNERQINRPTNQQTDASVQRELKLPLFVGGKLSIICQIQNCKLTNYPARFVQKVIWTAHFYKF